MIMVWDFQRYQSKIFDRTYVPIRKKGLGLGLAIDKKLWKIIMGSFLWCAGSDKIEFGLEGFGQTSVCLVLFWGSSETT